MAAGVLIFLGTELVRAEVLRVGVAQSLDHPPDAAGRQLPEVDMRVEVVGLDHPERLVGRCPVELSPGLSAQAQNGNVAGIALVDIYAGGEGGEQHCEGAQAEQPPSKQNHER